MFLVNSRSPLASATLTPNGPAVSGFGPPFSRSYGGVLPSSFTTVRPCAWACSARPPVSVWGTGGPAPRVEAFLGATGSPCFPGRSGRVTIAPHPRHRRQPPGFAWAAGRALERAEPSDPRGHHCASPLLIRLPTCAEGPQTPAAPPPAGPKTGWGALIGRRGAWVSTRASARSVSGPVREYQPVIHRLRPSASP